MSYLDEMRAAFGEARGPDARTVSIVIDDAVVELAFAGPDLADALLPALKPVLAEPVAATPILTVELWDSASTGVAPPKLPWGPEGAGRLGAVIGQNDRRFKAVVEPGGWMVTVADLDAGRAAVWVPSTDAVASWWRALSLRVLLGWAVERPGRHMVHAGAVGADGRGALICGAGGAGKSTLAVACAEAGMDFLSDDYLVLSATDAGPLAHAVYGTAKLDQHSLDAFPALAARVSIPGDYDKAVVDIAALRPERLARTLPVVAAILPSLGAEGPPRRVPAAAALRALAASTIFQAPDGGAAALALTADVLRRVPAYELPLGPDVSAAPARLAALVAAAG